MLWKTFQKDFRLIAIADVKLLIAAMFSTQLLHARPLNLIGQKPQDKSQAQKTAPFCAIVRLDMQNDTLLQSAAAAKQITDFLTSQGARATSMQQEFGVDRISGRVVAENHLWARAALQAWPSNPAEFEPLSRQPADPSMLSRLKNNLLWAVGPGRWPEMGNLIASGQHHLRDGGENVK